ncbi:MAG: sterol desaturase family protein [Gammaproteobacteria bacterium]|nr:sterol desaturase family protein [Gammaproteobacteria bacterium]
MQLDQIITQITNDRFTAVALPLFVLAIVVEALISHRQHRNLYAAKDFGVSMIMLVLSSFVDFLPKLAAFITFVYLHELSPLRDVVQRQWWAWLLLFFLDDFVYYWFHRANHEVRVFWAGHVPHHSSVKLNFGTALRQGVGERVHKYLFWVPLPLLGFDPLMIFTIISLNLVYQFWVHTELVRKLPGVIEWLFNTPSHHRVHHASNIRYLDRNHAGGLIIWDRIFGTFSRELDAEPVEYGLTKNINTYNPAAVAAGEYLSLWHDISAAEKPADKLRYLFLAPGWHHDGEDRRSNILRARG